MKKIKLISSGDAFLKTLLKGLLGLLSVTVGYTMGKEGC